MSYNIVQQFLESQGTTSAPGTAIGAPALIERGYPLTSVWYRDAGLIKCKTDAELVRKQQAILLFSQGADTQGDRLIVEFTCPSGGVTGILNLVVQQRQFADQQAGITAKITPGTGISWGTLASMESGTDDTGRTGGIYANAVTSGTGTSIVAGTRYQAIFTYRKLTGADATAKRYVGIEIRERLGGGGLSSVIQSSYIPELEWVKSYGGGPWDATATNENIRIGVWCDNFYGQFNIHELTLLEWDGEPDPVLTATQLIPGATAGSIKSTIASATGTVNGELYVLNTPQEAGTGTLIQTATRSGSGDITFAPFTPPSTYLHWYYAKFTDDSNTVYTTAYPATYPGGVAISGVRAPFAFPVPSIPTMSAVPSGVPAIKVLAIAGDSRGGGDWAGLGSTVLPGVTIKNGSVGGTDTTDWHPDADETAGYPLPEQEGTSLLRGLIDAGDSVSGTGEKWLLFLLGTNDLGEAEDSGAYRLRVREIVQFAIDSGYYVFVNVDETRVATSAWNESGMIHNEFLASLPASMDGVYVGNADGLKYWSNNIAALGTDGTHATDGYDWRVKFVLASLRTVLITKAGSGGSSGEAGDGEPEVTNTDTKTMTTAPQAIATGDCKLQVRQGRVVRLTIKTTGEITDAEDAGEDYMELTGEATADEPLNFKVGSGSTLYAWKSDDQGDEVVKLTAMV